MKTPVTNYDSLHRYVYLMIGSVALMAALVLVALYAVQDSDHELRDRVALFHISSYATASEMRRNAQRLAALVAEKSAPPSNDGVAGVQRPTSSVAAQLDMLVADYERIAQLQETFGGAQFEGTVSRIGERVERLRSAIAERSGDADVLEAARLLDVAANQLARLHVNEAEHSLGDHAGTTVTLLPLYAAIAAVVGATLIIGWFTTRLIRSAVRRQQLVESELAASRDQLHHMQKLEALGQLVGGVAHDFNNLLTAILGQAGRLRKQAMTDSSAQSGIEQIRKAATQAASLTRQLLAFSRMQPVDPRTFSVNELLEDTEGMLARMMGEDVTVTVTRATDIPAVRMDPTQLRQVILNLAGNARDAMPSGGNLRISSDEVFIDRQHAEALDLPSGSYVQLNVSDDGVGMSEDTQQRVFEPFFTTKPMGRGTGLGLSTVHGIISAADGRIDVSSQLGAGTSFRIWLPAAEGPAEALEREPAPAPSPEGKETVLVVEDEELIRAMLEEGLGHYGYRVLTAASASEGLDLCGGEQGEIDVIISDVIMPDTNGAEFLQAARKLQPRATCLLMSGYTDNVFEKSGLDVADIPLIPKPFEIEGVARLIRERLEADV